MQKAVVGSMKKHFKVDFVICSAEEAWSWNVIPAYGFQNFMQSQIVSLYSQGKQFKLDCDFREHHWIL